MVLEKLFLVLFCGTADVDDEDSYEENKTIIFNQVHRFLGEETQAYTVKERHGNIKIMGIFKFYSFSTNTTMK